ncbi:MAG TPA: DUF4389 domain-containing protein [Actinomycetota bacterium]|nr:DUF4389 domain-containing protein [Actinomycetota bacterium]
MTSSPGSYPVSLEGTLDEALSRWKWLVKWFLAIPHFIVLLFLILGALFVSIGAWFAILFTGKYPRALFDYNAGVLRWGWRVAYYCTGVLGTDKYPPFSLDDDPAYPARLNIEYPEKLSRGLVLVKAWLLALPHLLIIGLLTGGAYSVTTDNTAIQVTSPGLIGILAVVAGLILLFTGKYNDTLFDLLMGLNRWVYRVCAYVLLMTDEYPPFRLDQGGTESPAPLAGPVTPLAG